MTLSLSPQVEEMIRKRLESGQYATADEVVLAGLVALEQEEQPDDLAPGELDALLEEGERSGEYLDGRKVLSELRELRLKHADGRR